MRITAQRGTHTTILFDDLQMFLGSYISIHFIREITVCVFLFVYWESNRLVPLKVSIR